MPLGTFLLVVCILSISANFAFDSNESSDSIEIPDRPEDRQAFKMSNQHVENDSKTLLNLISKVVGTFQGSFENRAKKIGKKSNMKYLVQKTRKALNGINKAYSQVEKAKKKLRKNKFYRM